MPLVNPQAYSTAHQYAVGTIPPPLLNPIPVETGLASTYVLHSQGLRSETSQDITRYSGELVITSAGEYISRTVIVADDSGVYQQEFTQLDNGGGANNLVTVDDKAASTSALAESAEFERKLAEAEYANSGQFVDSSLTHPSEPPPPIQSETGGTPSDYSAPPETGEPVSSYVPPPDENVAPAGCNTWTETWFDENGYPIIVYFHDDGNGHTTVYT